MFLNVPFIYQGLDLDFVPELIVSICLVARPTECLHFLANMNMRVKLSLCHAYFIYFVYRLLRNCCNTW